MKDYYAILEINENSSKEIIEKVHKLLVKKYHPDLHKQEDKKEAEEKLKDINEAYEVLTNPSKKESYDKKLKEYKKNEIIKEINKNSLKENVKFSEKNSKQEFEDTNMANEEFIRKTQQYYDEMYRQYLYKNGYIKEDFKMVFKRYLALFLTAIVVSVICYIIYKIPYTNKMLVDYINSNQILKIFFGKFVN